MSLKEGTESLYKMAWLFYLLLAASAVVWIGWRTDSPISWGLFLRKEHLTADVALGLAAAAALLGLWELMRRIGPGAQKLEEELGGILSGASRADLVGLALLSGFGEELFFRGALQGAVGWPLATLAFALLHTGSGKHFRYWTLFAAVAGAAFAGLTIWRASLLPAVIAHVLVNGINILRLEVKDQAA